MSKMKSLDQYRKEANISPFVLEVDDNKSITVQPPTGDDILELTNVSIDDAVGLLQGLCGDSYDEVMEVLGKEPAPVLFAVIMDMMKHFGITDLTNAQAGSRASRRS